MAPREQLLTRADSDEEEVPILAATRHLLKSNGSILGSDVAKTIEPLYPSFASAIPTASDTIALASIDGRQAISHARIYDFCVNYYGPALHRLGFGNGHRIALVLPNGPELALSIVATANWASCVPLSANGAASELEADLQRCGADLVIGPYSGDLLLADGFSDDNVLQGQVRDKRFCVLDNNGGKQDYKVFQSIQESAKKLDIPFVGLVPSPDEAGIFRLVVPSDSVPVTAPASLYFNDDERAAKSSLIIRLLRQGPVNEQSNQARDEVMVLFTSGTTGNKKLVPHQLGDMLTAATTIALSWALTPNDVNCNLMPLFHVGGIVRQVFSPLISGGCVICCPSFDPSIFWALLAKRAFTWYYAAPTMHQIILQSHEPEKCPSPSLRMIANAAGGLLPSLAVQLRERFNQANVLPSYGMTECMPISSPPATYELTKPGTSGVPVGPEVAILNLMSLKSLPPGEEGPICVRGEPCFRGYGKLANDPNAEIPESFLPEGWFNTGDLGYLDEDGYLYITGRSKEVINRGGEIISPMEVEEAVSGHPSVNVCAAFSADHDVLQEVVGVAIVMNPGCPRIDLMSLHAFLGDKLAAPKWPQCLIFLDGLPKSHTNKVLRVKLGKRLCLPELTDEMAPIQRTFEASCPPQGTALDVPMPVRPVSVSAEDTEAKLKAILLDKDDRAFAVESRDLKVLKNSKKVGSLICYIYNIDSVDAIEASRQALDGFAIPTHFVEVSGQFSKGATLPEPTTRDALETILQRSRPSGPVDPLVETVQNIFVQLLKLDYFPAPDANFFHLGGSSMLASQMASKVRKEFGVSCSGAEIFHHSTSQDLAQMIRKRHLSTGDTLSTASMNVDDDSASGSGEGKAFSDHGAPFEARRLPLQCGWGAMLFQLVPMFVVFPFWQVTRYLLFFGTLMKSLEVVPTDRNAGSFVLAYFAFHICWVTITPLFFVLIKWIIIGRYKPGRFPIWSSYYLRWWFVDLCRKLFLRGIWGSNEAMLNFYYRLLGAKIGKGARISLEADVAEFDLVTVGDYAAVEISTLRGFGVDNGAMLLGPVRVGHRASVGAKSVVAPHTSIPDHCHLGPATSSYDIQGLNDRFARVNRRRLPEPSLSSQILVVWPISFLVSCVGQIPPLFVLLWMLSYKGNNTDMLFLTPSDLMSWLCDPHRIPFYVGIRVARAILSPFFYMAAAIIVKWTVIGEFKAGPRNTTSEWELLRHHLSARLFSRKRIQHVADIVGRHYEVVSCLYRLLGAKVGKRVFWPGSQPVFSGEFDLLEIGDDVVFGSRSLIFFSSIDACEKVILCAGANVSDNCVVLPGSVVGKSATLGSNSLCPEGWYLPENSVWFGSKGGEPSCLDPGRIDGVVKPRVASRDIASSKLCVVGDASTLRPFGKAFYMRKATYFVWPLSLIIPASVLIKAVIAFFHSLPLLASIHGAGAMLYPGPFQARDYLDNQYSFTTIYWAVLFVFFWVNIVRVAMWLGLELIAKWSLMGRRTVGTYNYDTTSYAQRWELYQLIAKGRKFSRFNFLQFFYGTPFMNYYFRWNGGNVGKDVCLYPTGADPFMPEPDLVTIGDRCVIDCAALVCHLNTRGNFELARITLEQECTLQCRSRIQQGVYMESGSQLLAKSVAMTGEVVEADSVWVGCPASWWFQYASVSAATRSSSKESLTSEEDEDDGSDISDEKSSLLKKNAKASTVYGV